MPYRHKKNGYQCPAGHRTITIDLDDGVTPMMIDCPECGKRAASEWYAVDQSLEPSIGFYTPNHAQLLTQTPAVKEHVLRGGLLNRPLSADERVRFAGTRFD